jgi:GT2 family glycosyltransferase
MVAYDSEDPRIAVVILTVNQREKILSCIASLKADHSIPFQVLVWDNGSMDGTVEAVQYAYPDILVHRYPSNLGVASGRNAAAELAIRKLNPTHLLFLDNDIYVEPGFVGALYEPFRQDEFVGQTQAKLRFFYDRERLNDGGGCSINFLLARTRPVGYGEIDQGQRDSIKKCISCGGAMMVRTDIFCMLGGFDVKFDPYGPEDLDFSLRLSKAGYLALYIPRAMGFHEVSHYFGRDYNENYARNKSRYWFVFLQRHARFHQKLGFYLFGAPYLALRIILREGKKGNLGAFRGLLRGMFDRHPV